MTESEVIKFVKLFREEWDKNSKTRNAEALDVAIQTLEEVQQYRAIGTPEELQDMKSDYFEALSDWRQYRKIGTLEECREAVTKQISRHPVDKTKPDSGYGNYYKNARVIVCPNCNGRLKFAINAGRN